MKFSLKHNVDIINDVSCFRFDQKSFDTIKNKARKNPDLNVYGKQFKKEYSENSITEIQEFIGNSRNIK